MEKKCILCGRLLPIECFHKSSCNKDRHDNRCKECKRKLAHDRRDENYFEQYCITKKSECKRKGLPYDLDPEYLESIWTGICPIFNVPISKNVKGRGSVNSAHLDRLVPEKGYVKGNVTWICGRANRIKYDATIEELKQIIKWMERVTTIPEGSTP